MVDSDQDFERRGQRRLLFEVQIDTLVGCRRRLSKFRACAFVGGEPDELLDWLMSQNPKIVAELREARRQDLAGKFKAWKPRHVSWPTESK